MAFHLIGCILRPQRPLGTQSLLLRLLAVSILTGCGRPAADPPLQIRITPAAATLAPGASLTLRARCTEATGSERPCPQMTWRLEGGSLLTVDGSDTVRQFTAGDHPGVFVVRASSGTLGTLAAITVIDGSETANVTIRPTERHQTLRGWEAAVSAGWRVSPGAFAELATRAASEMGLTRMRMEITGNQVETRTDLRGTCGNTRRIVGVNDNADPSLLDPAGFNWLCLGIESAFEPKQVVEESLYELIGIDRVTRNRHLAHGRRFRWQMPNLPDPRPRRRKLEEVCVLQ